MSDLAQVYPDGWRPFSPRETVVSLLVRQMRLELGGWLSPREEVAWYYEARARIAACVEWDSGAGTWHE